jgi:hypothetical protein
MKQPVPHCDQALARLAGHAVHGIAFQAPPRADFRREPFAGFV